MFWLRFARLLASVAWEGVYSLLCILAFFFLGRRRIWRERIAREMCAVVPVRTGQDFRGQRTREQRSRGPGIGGALSVVGALSFQGARLLAGAVGVVSLLLASGCTQFPGASFERQLENTAQSTEFLLDQTGEFDGLVGDLRKLFFDPEWDQMPDTLEQLGW